MLCDDSAFLDAMDAAPADALPRGIFNDYLMERSRWTWPDILALVCRRPASDALRLLAAQWCEESAGVMPCGRCVGKNGEPYWGLRQRCELCHSTGSVPDSLAERAEFIRVQVELERLPPERRTLRALSRDRETDGYSFAIDLDSVRLVSVGDVVDIEVRHPNYVGTDYGVIVERLNIAVPVDDATSGRLHSTSSVGPDPHADRRAALRRREQELMPHADPYDAGYVVGENENAWLPPIIKTILMEQQQRSRVASLGWRWRRGFVDGVECEAVTWLRHADALRAAAPVTRVRLTTWPEVAQDGRHIKLMGGKRKLGICARCDHDYYPIRGNITLDLLAAEFPGIDFELPAVTVYSVARPEDDEQLRAEWRRRYEGETVNIQVRFDLPGPAEQLRRAGGTLRDPTPEAAERQTQRAAQQGRRP